MISNQIVDRVNKWLDKNAPFEFGVDLCSEDCHVNIRALHIEWRRAVSNRESKTVLPSIVNAIDGIMAGILVALVRESWRRPFISSCWCPTKGWAVVEGGFLLMPGAYFSTEIEALVSALEASILTSA